MALLMASVISMQHVLLYTKQYLVLELVELIIGPTSDIFILVLWPIELQLFLHLVGPSAGGGSSRVNPIRLIRDSMSIKYEF